jgi:hypothetical protein
MTQGTDSVEAEPVELELGSLLFETAEKTDKIATGLLLLLGFFCFMFGLGLVANPRQIGGIVPGIVLGISLIAVCAVCCLAAVYFWLRNLGWRCYEHGVIESTRWTKRTLLYRDVQTIDFSITRTQEVSGDYEQIRRLLTLKSRAGEPCMMISLEKRSLVGLLTDPIPATAMDSIRDHVASLVAERMELALNLSGAVQWTHHFRLSTDGIETTGRFGSSDFVPWNRISDIGNDHTAFYFWKDGEKRPFAKMQADEPNAYPGLQIVLRRIAPQLELSEKKAIVEIPEGSFQCPNCGKPTDSLKRYDFINLIFLGTHSTGLKERFAACPACMRRYLYVWGLTSVPLANIVWPFVIAPKLLTRLLATAIRGHSVQRPSFGRSLARDLAQLGLIGSIAYAITAGLFFAFGEAEIQKWAAIGIGGSLVSFIVFIVIGALADI